MNLLPGDLFRCIETTPNRHSFIARLDQFDNNINHWKVATFLYLDVDRYYRNHYNAMNMTINIKVLNEQKLYKYVGRIPYDPYEGLSWGNKDRITLHKADHIVLVATKRLLGL